MRKKSREMDSQWALEVMHKAPYITASFIDEDGKPYGLPLSPVPYHARLLFASRLLNRQPASASSMIRKAWK